MKKILVIILILIAILVMPAPTGTSSANGRFSNTANVARQTESALADANGIGNNLAVTLNVSRSIVGMKTPVLNSYANNATHSGTIDLSGYLIPGWTLYKVTMSIDNLTAAPEREPLGVINQNFNFQINEIAGTFFQGLAQGFYNQPFDGALLNYSIFYTTHFYDPPNRGNASIAIYLDYQTDANLTPRVNLTSSESVDTWGVYSVSNTILSSNTIYYAKINGSTLIKWGSPTPQYPQIYWYAKNGPGEFPSFQRGNSPTSWDTKDLEPLFNYTYVPWNTSTSMPLVFSSPEQVNISGASAQMTGNTWTFVSGTNITQIQFGSNQSVYINHNMTLWYRKTTTATTNWNIPTASSNVNWSLTFSASFPSPTTNRLANVTIPSDWTTYKFYNSTDPSTNITEYTRYNNAIVFSSMTNGVWTLILYSFNYLTNIQAPSLIRADSTVNINLTIEDSLNTPATSGSTNLSVQYKGATVWTPPNQTVTTGFVTYSSSIGTWVTSNGTHTIEAFWTNGYEAGYLTKDMMVYYPTSLVAASTQIAALIYTGGSFEIRVDFTDTFASTQLTATYATVLYSYDSSANVSLNDLGNGTWTADISTGGKIAGQHQVQVYGEGYGIENQTITIDVSLTYQSLPLISEWSAPKSNSITYLESTHLSVQYNLTDGNAIQGATVNATDGTTTWPMHWDPVGMNYTIQFNGTDFSGLPKTVGLTVTAWKSGYEPQVDSSLQLIVTEETGSSLSATILPADLSMTYAETLQITANYSFGGSPIASGIVQVGFNSSYSVPLQYNASTHLWYAKINASYIGLGTWNLNISADANGYVARSTLRSLSILEDSPTLQSSWPSNQATTDYATNVILNVTATDSLGGPILDAELNGTFLGSTFTMVHQGNGLYSVLIHPGTLKGTHRIVVTLDELGYATTSISLNLTVLATVQLVVAPQFQEYETEQLVIGVQYLDAAHLTPIDSGTVNLTIGGATFSGEWNGTMYVISFPLDYSVGYHPATIWASAEGANPDMQNIVIQVLQKSYVYLELRYVGDSAEGNQISIEAILRQNSTDAVIPYANINFEMTVQYDNGSTQHFTGQDSTNEQGVASITFQIPSGTEIRITSIDVTATYDGPKRVWDTSKSFVIPVHLGALPQFMNWLFFEDGRYVILLLGIAAVGAYGYNSRIKPKKRARRVALDTQLKDFNDLKSIQHFMAVYLNRGTCVFYHPFRESRIQADLISGFISAVTSVYGEIKGNGVQGSLEEIHYHGLRLNSYNGKYVLGILILDEEISPLMRDRLQFFVELFENEYESHLQGWTGLTDCFDPEWIVTNLVSTFGYSWALPHTIRIADKLSGTERKVLNYIKASLGDKREFLIEDYIAPIAELLHMRKAEAFDVLIRMEENEIFTPISIHTVLQRQGMGMVATAEDIEEVGEVYVASSEEPEETIAEEPAEEGEPTPEEMEPEVTEGEGEEEPAEVQPAPQTEEPEEKEKKHVDPKDAFVAEVESLLKKEKDSEDED